MTLKVPLMTSAVQGPDSERKCGKFDLLTYIIINCTAGSRGTDMRGGEGINHTKNDILLVTYYYQKFMLGNLISD